MRNNLHTDLSHHQRPLGGFFEMPSGAPEWERYRLSAGQVDFFHEHGYLAGVRVLTNEQVEQLRAELDELADEANPKRSLFYEYHANESSDPARTLFHALGAWRAAPGFHDLLWHPAFNVPAAQLLGGAVRFWHDQLFSKPARSGGIVAWHQDYSYWTRTVPVAHLTCWIALDDATRDNGCVHYIPGSQRWDLLPVTGLADRMDAIDAVLSEEQRKYFRPVAIELKRGEASFHHPLMVHGSYENSTERSRRATVINLFRDGVRSASDEPLLAGVPPIPQGEEIKGRFFPLLFDPRRIASSV